MTNRFCIAIVALLSLFTWGCRTVSSGGGPGPVFLDAHVTSSPVPAWVRSDPFKRLWLVGVNAPTRVSVIDPDTGFPLWTENVPAGKVFVYSAKPSEHKSFEPDALPSWAAQAFLANELTTSPTGLISMPFYGISFAPDTDL